MKKLIKKLTRKEILRKKELSVKAYQAFTDTSAFNIEDWLEGKDRKEYIKLNNRQIEYWNKIYSRTYKEGSEKYIKFNTSD